MGAADGRTHSLCLQRFIVPQLRCVFFLSPNKEVIEKEHDDVRKRQQQSAAKPPSKDRIRQKRSKNLHRVVETKRGYFKNPERHHTAQSEGQNIPSFERRHKIFRQQHQDYGENHNGMVQQSADGGGIKYGGRLPYKIRVARVRVPPTNPK